MNSSIYIIDSKNSKLSGNRKVDCTYMPVSISCSNSCPLKDKGCYSQLGYVGIVVGRLEKEMKSFSPLQAARAEAMAIDTSYNSNSVPIGRDLRLHVSGDSRTITGTRIINKAIGRWKQRGGGDSWSYTHSWRHVSRSEWSNVSILASIESVKDVKEVRRQGYAPALVVDNHPSNKVYYIKGSDVKWIPCPAQTKSIPCVECRLCFNADRLFRDNMGITFAAHGAKKSSIKRHLTVIK